MPRKARYKAWDQVMDETFDEVVNTTGETPSVPAWVHAAIERSPLPLGDLIDLSQEDAASQHYVTIQRNRTHARRRKLTLPDGEVIRTRMYISIGARMVRYLDDWAEGKLDHQLDSAIQAREKQREGTEPTNTRAGDEGARRTLQELHALKMAGALCQKHMFDDGYSIMLPGRPSRPKSRKAS